MTISYGLCYSLSAKKKLHSLYQGSFPSILLTFWVVALYGYQTYCKMFSSILSLCLLDYIVIIKYLQNLIIQGSRVILGKNHCYIEHKWSYAYIVIIKTSFSLLPMSYLSNNYTYYKLGMIHHAKIPMYHVYK